MKKVEITIASNNLLICVKSNGIPNEFIQCPAKDALYVVKLDAPKGVGIHLIPESAFYPNDSIISPFGYQGSIEVEFDGSEYGYFEALISYPDLDKTGGLVKAKVLNDKVFDDIDIYLNPDDFSLEIENGDFKATNKFDTLIYTLLFTDARASKYQVEPAIKRKGWIGDIEQRYFRSRLWLKDMAKITQNDLNQIEAYCLQALQYMIENRICSNIAVDAVQSKKLDEIGVNIIIETGSDVLEKYIPIWRQNEI